jgi:hypothetical protein
MKSIKQIIKDWLFYQPIKIDNYQGKYEKHMERINKSFDNFEIKFDAKIHIAPWTKIIFKKGDLFISKTGIISVKKDVSLIRFYKTHHFYGTCINSGKIYKANFMLN